MTTGTGKGTGRRPRSVTRKIGLISVGIGLALFSLVPLTFLGLRATLWSITVAPGEQEVELETGTVFVYPDGSSLSTGFGMVDSGGNRLFVDHNGELGYSVRIPTDGTYTVSTDQQVDLGNDRGVPFLFALLVGLVAFPLGFVALGVGVLLLLIGRQGSPR